MNELKIEFQNPDINSTYTLEEYHQKSVMDSNCIEFWAPISDRALPGIYPNRYWVSTFGNTWNASTNKPFGLSIHKKGYFQCPFMTTYGARLTRKLHRMIMMTFCYVPGCENLEVNHKDSNRQNNAISNLEWATASENTIHGILYGNKIICGRPEATVLLSDTDVENILQMYKDGISIDDIYTVYHRKYDGLSRILVENICRGVCRIAYQRTHMKSKY